MRQYWRDQHVTLEVVGYILIGRWGTVGNRTRHYRMYAPSQRSCKLIEPSNPVIRHDSVQALVLIGVTVSSTIDFSRLSMILLGTCVLLAHRMCNSE